MRGEEDIKREWQELDSIDEILRLVRECEYNVQEYLANTVASLCDVDVDTMMSNCDKIYIAQARWLFWYAYRYMTNETYEKIGEMSRTRGKHPFTTNTIGQAINKMSALIESEPIWKKRWMIIKRIIKLRDEVSSEKKTDNTIIIQVPRELRDKLNIQIKEK